MKVRPHKGKEPGPDLPGSYYKFMLDAAFLISEPAPIAERLPFAVMHMRKPPQQTRVLAREPTTAEDTPAQTLVDAPPTATLAAGSESPEEVTGLIERLSLAGAAASSDGGTDAIEGGAAASGGGAACAQCGLRSEKLRHCARCLQVAYCCKE